jgi:hypothetical protein
MRGERAQATVEHVGAVLAVALLAGAVVALLGDGRLASGVARAVGAALDRALGFSLGTRSAPTQIRATPAQLALFGAATDPSMPEDQRPTLRDVRLRLEEELGREAGDALFRQMLLGEVAALRPGTRQEMRFAPTLGAIMSPETLFARAPPSGPSDSERPTGDTTLHVTTAAEESSYLRNALHGRDVAGTVLDIGGAIPIEVVQQLVEVAGAVRAAIDQLDEAKEVLLRTDGIRAGAREGDVIACWPVLRTRPSGSSAGPDDELSWNAQAHHYYHLAVVREDTVVAEYLVPNPGRSTSCNLS